MVKCVSIFVDGSYSTKSLFGSYAIIVVENDTIIERFVSVVEPPTTNIVMEFRALLCGMIYCINNPAQTVTIYSDSEYCVNMYNVWADQWIIDGQIENKKNQKLIRSMLSLRTTILSNNTNLSVKWVKGHSGNKYHDMVDKLAYDTRVLKQ